MEDTVYRVIEIENEIYNGWTPEERELFMKLNRDFAEKLSDKVKNFRLCDKIEQKQKGLYMYGKLSESR